MQKHSSNQVLQNLCNACKLRSYREDENKRMQYIYVTYVCQTKTIQYTTIIAEHANTQSVWGFKRKDVISLSPIFLKALKQSSVFVLYVNMI